MTEIAASGTLNMIPGSIVVAHDTRQARPWSISEKGIVFMAVWESGQLNGTLRGCPVQDGFILRVYDDGYGIPTVGLGHRVTPYDNLRLGDSIPLEAAKKFLRNDLLNIERAINKSVIVPLHQHEYDALVSILFNTGTNRRNSDPWRGSRVDFLAEVLNSGGYADMPDTIENFISKRVKSRRASEAKLFATGIYNATH